MQVFRFQESKSRGTAEFPIAYYYIDETHPRYQMPCHWHTECEIVHIRQGNFTARIDDTEYAMEPGDTLWIRGGALHSGVSRDCVYECIVFDLDLLRTDLGACQPLLEGLRQNLSEVVPLLPHTCTGIVRAAEDLIRSVREQPVGYAFLVLGGLYRLLGEIQQAGCIRAARPQFPAAYRSTAALKRALSYIEEHFSSEDLTLDTLAQEAGLNPRYFCRFFQQMTRKSPMQYVNWYRIEQAAWKLSHTDYSVTEIAFQCGFNDLSYFIRSFKKHKGVTPKQFSINYKKTGEHFSA
ncbi:MAG TPA: helix-turn-helix transcriptional regulator [Candidatus Gallacutalibacter pullicola]|uniref:Helix-turn-helix transcriptional regulator n=1 Tax=Candidatus Gallacutalibacter pullicola TaxID=2840830 RepID=A0A9D1DST4_9FIRM|nr:helix-turn-helix transcriptional regulator [Candidatus Gallacutalibacter pullicola]